MRRMIGAMACISALSAPIGANEHGVAKTSVPRGAAPMEALAEAILAIAPEARSSGTPTLQSMRAKPSPIRWKESPARAGESIRAVGTLAGGIVTAPNGATVSEISFEWNGPEGQPFGFNPIQALKKKGFDVQALYCASMVSEGTNYFLVTAPGKRPGFLSVYAFDAPMAISLANWSITYRLDGQVPSLAAVHADGDPDASTDCEAEIYGPVKRISRAEALSLVQSRTGGAVKQLSR